MADITNTTNRTMANSYNICNNALSGLLDNEGKYPHLTLTDAGGTAKAQTYMDNYLLSRTYTHMAFTDGEGVSMLVGWDTDDKGHRRYATGIDFPVIGVAPLAMRTISITNGVGSTKPGTTGNDALMNNKKTNMMSSSAIRVNFNHRWDDSYFLPDEQAELLNLSLDSLNTYLLNSVAYGIAFSKSITILAQHLKAGLNYKKNIVNLGKDRIEEDGYLREKLIELTSKLDNPDNGLESGIISYPKTGEIIVIRASKENELFSKKSGLMDYGDLTNRMIGNNSFDPAKPVGMDAERFNRGYRLNTMIKVLPDVYFDKAIELLGGSTELSKIYGYVAHSQGTQFATIADKTEILRDTAENTMGAKIKTFNVWGAETAHPNSVALLVESATDKTSDFVNPAETKEVEIIAPNNWSSSSDTE